MREKEKYKGLLIPLIAVFILLDTGYTFLQFFHTHLDGDMASFILQTEEWKKVLGDPFGMNVLFHNEYYPDPNRYFSHWFISFYFTHIPFYLHSFINPIDSIYLSCAVIKIIIQLLLIYMMASIIAGKENSTLKKIIGAGIIVPLFQTYGYSGYIGIIDQSVSYFFFYALPFTLLIMFYYYLLFKKFKNKNIDIIKNIILIIFVFILPFSGPLIPGIILIVHAIILMKIKINQFIDNREKSFIKVIFQFDKDKLFIFILLSALSILSLLSLYIGTHNSINVNSISITERYSRLPQGLYFMITQKLGLPLLLIITGINAFIIYKYYNSGFGNKILKYLNSAGLFSLIYILLLPLGGYRFYRPNIIRFDTFMPITFLMILFYGISSVYLITKLNKKIKMIYVIYLFIISIIYTLADKPDYKEFYCERKALEEISGTKDKILKLNDDCKVMSWNVINDYKQSEHNADLLNYWGVTQEKILYYH